MIPHKAWPKMGVFISLFQIVALMPLDFKMTPQDAEARMRILAVLRYLVAFDCDQLSRKGDVGTEWAFDDIIAYAKDALELLKTFDPDAVFWAPASVFNPLKSYVEQLEAAFNRIMNFTSTMDYAKDHRAELLTTIPALRDGIYRDLLSAVVFLSQRKLSPSSLAKEAKELLSEVTDEITKAKDDIEETAKEATRIVSGIRDAAGEKGVTGQAAVFEQEANRHAEAAKVWGIATGLLGVGLVGLALGAYVYFPVPKTALEAAHSIATKAIFFGTLVYLLTLSARNLMSHKHNSIVNKHRHNALSIYRVLVDAGHSPESRDIILGRAADSIFGQQETGYSKAESAPIKAIEVSPKIGGAA